jgi:hypothetical protein
MNLLLWHSQSSRHCPTDPTSKIEFPRDKIKRIHCRCTGAFAHASDAPMHLSEKKIAGWWLFYKPSLTVLPELRRLKRSTHLSANGRSPLGSRDPRLVYFEHQHLAFRRGTSCLTCGGSGECSVKNRELTNPIDQGTNKSVPVGFGCEPSRISPYYVKPGVLRCVEEVRRLTRPEKFSSTWSSCM